MFKTVNPIRLGTIDYAQESEEISETMPILDVYTLGSVCLSRLDTLYLPYRYYSKSSLDYKPQQPGNDFVMWSPCLRTVHLPSELSMSTTATFATIDQHEDRDVSSEHQVIVRGPEDVSVSLSSGSTQHALVSVFNIIHCSPY